MSSGPAPREARLRSERLDGAQSRGRTGRESSAGSRLRGASARVFLGGTSPNGLAGGKGRGREEQGGQTGAELGRTRCGGGQLGNQPWGSRGFELGGVRDSFGSWRSATCSFIRQRSAALGSLQPPTGAAASPLSGLNIWLVATLVTETFLPLDCLVCASMKHRVEFEDIHVLA